MRALHLTADYPPAVWSGIGRAVAARARALHARGVAITILDASGQRHPPAPGPRVLPLTPRRCPVDPAAYDLLHLHSLPLAGLAIEMRRRTNRPLAYTAHSSLAAELPPGPTRRAWQPVQDHLFQTADVVVFLNRAEHANAAARFPRLRQHGRVIPHGLFPAPIPARRDEGFVLFAGRFTRNKGADVVAGVIERLAPAGVHFVAAGGHGVPEITARLTAVARRHPARCRLPGWLDAPALQELLRRATLVIMPSRYEPFGLFALEALRAGAPLLAAGVGGLRDIVTADSGGEIVPAMTVDRWSSAITTLIADPAHRARLSTRGPVHVARRFHAGRLARRMRDEVYGPLLRPRPSPRPPVFNPRPAL